MRYLLIILTLLLCSCKALDNNSEKKFEEIYFNIDKSLLSESYTIDNNFKFSPPQNMIKDKEVFNMLNQYIDLDTNSYFPIELIEAFNNDNILLYITKIKDENLFSKLDSSYNEALKNTYNIKDINIGAYNVNGLNLYQYIFSDQNSVTIKLYLNSFDNYYEITYIVNKLFYESILKQVESSIGSINSFYK